MCLCSYYLLRQIDDLHVCIVSTPIGVIPIFNLTNIYIHMMRTSWRYCDSIRHSIIQQITSPSWIPIVATFCAVVFRMSYPHNSSCGIGLVYKPITTRNISRQIYHGNSTSVSNTYRWSIYGCIAIIISNYTRYSKLNLRVCSGIYIVGTINRSRRPIMGGNINKISASGRRIIPIRT